MEIFEAIDIKKRYEGVIALKGVSLKFDGPKICGLVGANGSGKTTFAKICCGLVNKDEGELKIDGKHVNINTPLDAKNYGIVLAHQNLSLIPDLTVWENIDLGHEVRKGKFFLNKNRSRTVAFNFLEELSGNGISIDSKVTNLSPSNKQIVEIVKALSQNPRLLILDEPTAALEYFQVERLFKKIQELKRAGISVIFISHRMQEILNICDIVFAFRNGELAGVVDFSKQARDESVIIPLVTGKESYKLNNVKSCKRDFSDKEIVLELKDVNLKTKLKNINLSLHKGEILGIGGLQGQGQDYLTMVISGAIPISSGKIYIDDKEVKFKQPLDAIKRGIYLIPGERTTEGLFMDRNVFDNLIYPRLSLAKDKFVLNFKNLYKLTDSIIKKTLLENKKKEMIVSNLSGGNQQKVVFGRWLQFSPKVLVLNDPAKGVDIQARNDLYNVVKELSLQGTSVILYSTSNEELISNCDRVLILFEGEIVDELMHENICHENLISSYLRVKGD